MPSLCACRRKVPLPVGRRSDSLPLGISQLSMKMDRTKGKCLVFTDFSWPNTVWLLPVGSQKHEMCTKKAFVFRKYGHWDSGIEKSWNDIPVENGGIFSRLSLCHYRLYLNANSKRFERQRCWSEGHNQLLVQPPHLVNLNRFIECYVMILCKLQLFLSVLCRERIMV
jgi:hypothetical protein